MWKDFKSFISRGNVLDLAIGVIIGAAFTTVVKTFTDGIIMPFVGLISGGVDFKQKVWNLGSMPVTNAAEIEAALKAKQPLILYGQFINDVITFLIVARRHDVKRVAQVAPHRELRHVRSHDAHAPLAVLAQRTHERRGARRPRRRDEDREVLHERSIRSAASRSRSRSRSASSIECIVSRIVPPG